MKPKDTKMLLFFVKLIVPLCAVLLIVVNVPQHAHYLLLIVSVALVIFGLGSLLKYKEQGDWVEKKARLKSIKEREEEVAMSEYSRIKYYYPEIEYEYVANGATHLGKVVSFEKENVWVPEVDNWGDATPVGKRWWLSLKPAMNFLCL